MHSMIVSGMASNLKSISCEIDCSYSQNCTSTGNIVNMLENSIEIYQLAKNRYKLFIRLTQYTVLTKASVICLKIE